MLSQVSLWSGYLSRRMQSHWRWNGTVQYSVCFSSKELRLNSFGFHCIFKCSQPDISPKDQNGGREIFDTSPSHLPSRDFFLAFSHCICSYLMCFCTHVPPRSVFRSLSLSLPPPALNMTSASSFQMLRGAVIIFTGLLSVAFLGRKLQPSQWVGIFITILGLVVVGLADFITGNRDESHKLSEVITGECGKMTFGLNVLFTSIMMRERKRTQSEKV